MGEIGNGIQGRVLRQFICNNTKVLALDMNTKILYELFDEGGAVGTREREYEVSGERIWLPEMEDVYPKDRARLSEALNQECIRQAYQQEGCEILEVFRKCEDGNGKYEWHELRITVPRKDEGDLVLFNIENIGENMEFSSDVKVMNDVISIASIEKNNFLLKIIQELETPLNHIIGISKILKEVRNHKLEDSYQQEIEDSARYIKESMSRILDISMYMEHGKTLQYSRQKLDDMFKWLGAVFEPIAKKKQVSLRFATDTTYSNYVLMDKEKCMLVYYNILMNALEFTPTGGNISIETDQVYERENVIFVRSVIKDDGIGVSHEYQKHMFDVYDETVDESAENVGPGMILVKNFLHLMDGALHVESKNSHGTTVTITYTVEIPPEKMHDDKEEEKKQKVSIKGQKILLIEDNEINRSVTKNILDKAGAVVIEACDGTQALDRFQECEDGEISFILSDIMMPHVSGLSVADQIRQLDRKDAKAIPIIAVTANTFNQDVSRIFAYGMDAFIPKPVSRNGMLGVIDEVLHK